MSARSKLGLFDLTMIVVSLVIGMGIFRTPVVAAAKSGTQTVFYLAWIIGGLVALCGALTYAEIGSRYPVTGGYYRVFSYAYHPAYAFAVNGIVLLSNAGSTAIVAVIGAEYIGQFFFGGQIPVLFKQLVTIGAIGIFYVINILGLTMSSRVQNILVLIKISLILLLLLSLVGTYPVGASVSTPAGPATLTTPDTGTMAGFCKALGTALIAVFFCYGGYQQSINFGEEVSQPQRNIPRGIAYGIGIVILLYGAINYVYVRVIGFGQLQHSNAIAAILIRHLFGPVGENILRVLMFLSVLAYVNVSLLSNPRVMYAMSEEGILPALFKRRTPKRDVVIYSLTAFCLAISLTLVFSSAVEKIMNYTIFLDCIGMSSSAGAIFMLRRQRIGEQGGKIYRMGYYPLFPMIFILAYIVVAASILLDDPVTALYGIGIFGCFFLLYFLMRFRKGTDGVPV